MSMYADEEEDKVSAKDRIFSSIKRRVANKPQIEVYEEDVEDEAFDEPALEEGEQVDMRQRLNFKVITDYFLTFGDKGPFKYYVSRAVGGVRKWQFC